MSKAIKEIVKQTAPNINEILRAIRELEKDPVVQAYLALQRSLDPWSSGK